MRLACPASARVSTADQELDVQIAKLRAEGCKSGVIDLSDPAGQRVMAYFQIGDVWDIGRTSQAKHINLDIHYAE